MAKYQGHRSWNAWNIHLWVTSDEGIYFYVRDIVKKHGRDNAARILTREFDGQKTPDGARYNYTSIREAIRGDF